jgi:hypothetical protein
METVRDLIEKLKQLNPDDKIRLDNNQRIKSVERENAPFGTQHYVPRVVIK